MERVLVDTSAILALLEPNDEAHERAKRAFETLRARDVVLVATSYTLLETYALIGRRFGLSAVTRFRESFAPILDVVWVGRDLHDAALDLLVLRGRQRLSLVDAVSFVLAQREGITEAFAYDRHFSGEGLHLVQ